MRAVPDERTAARNFLESREEHKKELDSLEQEAKRSSEQVSSGSAVQSLQLIHKKK